MARNVLMQLQDLDPQRFPVTESYYFYERSVNYLLLFRFTFVHKEK